MKSFTIIGGGVAGLTAANFLKQNNIPFVLYESGKKIAGLATSFKDDEGFTYEKHKIFLYKEDFNKFVEALNNTVNHVKNELMPEVDFTQFDQIREERENQIAQAPTVDSELKWD